MFVVSLSFTSTRTLGQVNEGRIQMAALMKPIGRLEFTFRITVIAALVAAFEILLLSNVLGRASLPHYLRPFLWSSVFCLFGMYAANAIDGRLQSSGLPRSYRYAAFALWLLSISIPIFLPRAWPIAVGLFSILLVAGVWLPEGRAEAPTPYGDDMSVPGAPLSAPDAVVLSHLVIGPVSFLRTLLTFTCFALPLIWLEKSYGSHLSTIVAHLGYGVMYFIWVFKVVGRFADSGRSSNVYWLPFCVAVSVASALPFWFGLINRYETLVLFLLIQIPMAFLPSVPLRKAPTRQKRWGKEYDERIDRKRAEAGPLLVGQVAFLVALCGIACVWLLLIYIQNMSGDLIVRWGVRLGYCVLCLAWLMSVTGRFADAGWDHDWITEQFCLVVGVTCVMPFAVHWINGYEMPALFVLVQTPASLLRSRPYRLEPSSDSPSR